MARRTKESAKSQPAARARKDVAAFRESLFATLQRNCEGLSAADVVEALKTVSNDIYRAGIDDAYGNTEVSNPKNLADAWDLTWVTALNIDLRRKQSALRRRKSAKTRLPRRRAAGKKASRGKATRQARQ